MGLGIKKLVELTAICLVFIFISFTNLSCKKDSNNNNNNSKIVYTDLKTDSIVTGNEDIYSLDLNNDGIIDYELETFFGRLPCLIGGPTGQEVLTVISNVIVTPHGSNSVGDTTVTGGLPFPIMLGSNRNINQQSFGWNESPGQVMVHVNICAQSATGLWSGSIGQFLPLKLEVGTLVYFGWIRMDISNNGASITIKDYAFNSMPDQPILAGQTK